MTRFVLLLLACGASPAAIESASMNTYGRSGCVPTLVPPSNCIGAWGPLKCGFPLEVEPLAQRDVTERFSALPSAVTCQNLCVTWPSSTCFVTASRPRATDGGVRPWGTPALVCGTRGIGFETCRLE